MLLGSMNLRSLVSFATAIATIVSCAELKPGGENVELQTGPPGRQASAIPQGHLVTCGKSSIKVKIKPAQSPLQKRKFALQFINPGFVWGDGKTNELELYVTKIRGIPDLEPFFSIDTEETVRRGAVSDPERGMYGILYERTGSNGPRFIVDGGKSSRDRLLITWTASGRAAVTVSEVGNCKFDPELAGRLSDQFK